MLFCCVLAIPVVVLPNMTMVHIVEGVMPGVTATVVIMAKTQLVEGAEVVCTVLVLGPHGILYQIANEETCLICMHFPRWHVCDFVCCI